jgi:hypothetical protein
LTIALGTAAFLKTWPWSREADQPAGQGEATEQASANTMLTDVTDELGIDFVHNPGPPSFFYPAIIGAGVALFDFDQDGRLDIYFRNGTSGAPHPLADSQAQHTVSRLYHQQSNGSFLDVTGKSGLGDAGYGMGAAVGDVNNDGYPDIYVTDFPMDRLYLNRRDGTFTNISQSAGMGNRQWGTSATFLDFDRDGRLDLFTTNYVDYSEQKSCVAVSGREDFCNVLVFPPTRSRLYHNVTDLSTALHEPTSVRFEDVSEASGIVTQAGRGLGVRAVDFDSDGWPDIYVANDRSANFLWMNQRNGTFREMAIPLGLAYDGMGRATASMGIAEGDVDGDGEFDLLVTNLRGESNTLYRKSSSDFRDITSVARLRLASLPHTGWGTALADLDHDGDLDLIVVNGHVYQPLDKPLVHPLRVGTADSAAISAFWHAYADTNQVFLNDGTGKFQDCSHLVGPFTQDIGSARGLATGDIDDDGDLDLVVTSIGAAARIHRNDLRKDGHWLQLRALDPGLGNRDAYGAILTVRAGENRWVRRVQPGSSFLSSDSPQVHVGLGKIDQVDSIEVLWPDADPAPERFSGLSVNARHILRRGEGNWRPR